VLVEERLVEGEGWHHVDLVEDDGVGYLEHPRVFERLVIAFGHGENHHLDVFTQIKVRRTHKIADVLDEDEVDVVEVEHVECAA